MAKGIIYVMSTAVEGLIKIGKTEITNFDQCMYILEHNGYCNVAGLKRQFAIEVENYDDKEELVHELFSRNRVGKTELFSLNINRVIQLLASFEGKVVYPVKQAKSFVFAEATQEAENEEIENIEIKYDSIDRKKKRPRFKFSMIGIKVGEEIRYIGNPNVVCKVVSDDRVSYNGKTYSLSTLAEELEEKDSLQGPLYFEYKGQILDHLRRKAGK